MARFYGGCALGAAPQHEAVVPEREAQAREVDLRTAHCPFNDQPCLRVPPPQRNATSTAWWAWGSTVIAARRTKTSSLSAQVRSGSEAMAPGRVQRQQAADTRACMRSCALLRSGHQSLELNQGPGGHWPGQCPHGQASNPAICRCYQGAPSSFSDFILCQATLEHAATSRAQAGSGMATDETGMATDGAHKC